MSGTAKTRSLAAVLALIVATAGLIASAAGADAPTAAAVKAVSPIVLDGLPDEPAWQQAEWQTGFVVASVEGDDAPLEAAQVQTQFKVVYDDGAAYVAVECDEPAIDKLKAETPWRDGAVWADDCVEIFLDPGNEGRYYHQVMVNARGTIYDSHSADYGLVHSRLWNGAFRAAGRVDAQARRWSVEVEIPFGTLVLGEDAGGTWLWNVTRERHAGGEPELTSWAPLRRNFHQPRLFGRLTGLPGDYSAFRLEVDEPRVDVSRAGSGVVTLTLALAVRNSTATARRLAVTAAEFGREENQVSIEPARVGPGEQTSFDLPALELRGSTPRTNVVFSVRDADTGLLLKAVVKSLSSEYRPLTVRMVRPCYRDCIYATEDLREIVFEVEPSAQVRRDSVAVTCALLDAQGGQVATARVPIGELGRPVALPAGELAVGRYELKVAAVGEGGARTAEVTVPLRKLPPPEAGHEVRIDESRDLLVDGKPLFAIGWYGSVPTEDPRAEVVALQNIQTPVVPTLPDVSAIGRDFRERGIYSIVSVEPGRLYYTHELWQGGKEPLRAICEEHSTLDEPSDDLKRLAGELVEAVRGEPGLLGYYIADEPEIHNVRSSHLESYYRYLRELDPYHPVFVTNDTIDGIVTHGYKCADVVDPDPYSPEWDYVPNFLKKVNEVASRGKTSYVTLWHGSSQAHFNREYGTAPPYPYRVLRNQYFASIAYGAKGFTAYTSPFFMTEIEYRYGLPHIWRELRSLEGAILAPEPAEGPRVEGAPEPAVWARELKGHVYLLLVHHKKGEAAAKVSWAPLATRKSLYVMSEGREVAVTDGGFEDSFAEGDVHVYTDDPAARDLPTTREVEAELERRQREAVKPGNLLHWTRGTRVRCSAGYYAPWFHQFYYYAINGLTDDKGWSAYAWGGKPAWMEVTLKEPAEIGRVVLYTPNLRDYQLDLIAPGGAARRVSVTGNEETIVTHNLRPAVPCLKLRLTVTAVREADVEGGSGPLVSEIEAYAEPGEGPATPVEQVQAEAEADVKVLFGDETEPPALWTEDFRDFEAAPQFYWDERDTKWVLNAETFRATPRDGGGITVASLSPKGYDAMSRFFPYERSYRFLQARLAGIEGEGYRFANVALSDGSGKGGYRGAINTARPGLYTVDTYYIHDSYATGQDKRCFVRVNTAGSAKDPDGSVRPGPAFTFDWLRLVRRPLDGLAVTLADGSPLGATVRQGDRLHFETHLSSPAQDVVVEVATGASYEPLAINGQPYVQLQRADEEGRVWVGEVTLGPGTGTVKAGGYPVVFRAVITGGSIAETHASAFVGFE